MTSWRAITANNTKKICIFILYSAITVAVLHTKLVIPQIEVGWTMQYNPNGLLVYWIIGQSKDVYYYNPIEQIFGCCWYLYLNYDDY